MPRKSRRKSVESPATEPTPVAAVLEQSPIAQIIASREAKAETEPERPMPEPSEADAVAAFQRQREQEQAVTEPPKAEEPARRQKTWGETVRPWTTHARDTGVHHVTTTSPDMVGIRFDKGKERKAEEKREMEAIGLRFFTEAQAWLKTNRDGAFDETQDLARKFAERRRQAEAEISR
jgi:hypothetical protein